MAFNKECVDTSDGLLSLWMIVHGNLRIAHSCPNIRIPDSSNAQHGEDAQQTNDAGRQT